MRQLLPALILALLAASVAAAQPAEHRAGLVVQFGDGSVQTACVRFSEEQISGVELLERSGLPVVTQGGAIGAAVCKIGPDGCDYPAEGCFCRRDGARSIYWAFYRLDRSGWGYSSLGAANTPVRDGDVHGWAWGAGDSTGGALPPVVELATICGPGPARATATALATVPLLPPSPSPRLPTETPATALPAPVDAAYPLPVVTPASPAAPGGAPWSYLGFVVLALLLGTGAVLAAKRR